MKKTMLGILTAAVMGVTDKGIAWIEKALSTPMPVQKWVWE